MLDRVSLKDGPAGIVHSVSSTHGRAWPASRLSPAFCVCSFVAAFRRWLKAGGGGGPAWPEGVQWELPPRQLDREALLNRYEFHTRNCPDCLGVRSVSFVV